MSNAAASNSSKKKWQSQNKTLRGGNFFKLFIFSSSIR